MNQDALHRREVMDQYVLNLQWVLKVGIPSFVWAIKKFSDFGDANIVLQRVAIHLFLHQACYEMKEKYI